MSTVAEIKAAIPSLTLEEREEIARCLAIGRMTSGISR